MEKSPASPSSSPHDLRRFVTDTSYVSYFRRTVQVSLSKSDCHIHFHSMFLSPSGSG
jgi:hypothetical protein